MINNLKNSFSKLFLNSSFFTLKIINYKSKSIRIVNYHMISDLNHDYYFKNKALSTIDFQNHLDFYKKYFTILSLKQAIMAIDNNEKRKNILVLTFDDGFQCNYNVVLPILLKNNINATFFIISNCLNNKNLMWRNKLLLINKTSKDSLNKSISIACEKFNIKKFKIKDSLLNWSIKHWDMKKKEEITNFLWDECLDFSVDEYLDYEKPYLDSKQLLELKSFGNEIGSHSKSHPDFSNLSYFEFKEEIYNSSHFIERIINEKINYFSYPFGRVSSSFFEKKYKQEVNPEILFFGIKNSLNNHNSANRLERDNVEFEFSTLLFRFLILPVIRSLKTT